MANAKFIDQFISRDSTIFPRYRDVSPSRAIKHVGEPTNVLKYSATRYCGQFMVEQDPMGTRQSGIPVASVKCQRDHNGRTSYRIRLTCDFDPTQDDANQLSNIAVDYFAPEDARKRSVLLAELQPSLQQLVRDIIQSHQLNETKSVHRRRHRCARDTVLNQKSLRMGDLIDQRLCPDRVPSCEIPCHWVLNTLQFAGTHEVTFLFAPDLEFFTFEAGLNVESGSELNGLIAQDTLVYTPVCTVGFPGATVRRFQLLDTFSNRLTSDQGVFQIQRSINWLSTLVDAQDASKEHWIAALYVPGDQPLLEAVAITQRTDRASAHNVSPKRSTSVISEPGVGSPFAFDVFHKPVHQKYAAARLKARQLLNWTEIGGRCRTPRIFTARSRQVLTPVGTSTTVQTPLNSVELRTQPSRFTNSARANLCCSINQLQLERSNKCSSMTTPVYLAKHVISLLLRHQQASKVGWELIRIDPTQRQFTLDRSPICFNEYHSVAEPGSLDTNTNASHACNRSVDSCCSRCPNSGCRKPCGRTHSLGEDWWHCLSKRKAACYCSQHPIRQTPKLVVLRVGGRRKRRRPHCPCCRVGPGAHFAPSVSAASSSKVCVELGPGQYALYRCTCPSDGVSQLDPILEDKSKNADASNTNNSSIALCDLEVPMVHRIQGLQDCTCSAGHTFPNPDTVVNILVDTLNTGTDCGIFTPSRRAPLRTKRSRKNKRKVSFAPHHHSVQLQPRLTRLSTLENLIHSPAGYEPSRCKINFRKRRSHPVSKPPRRSPAKLRSGLSLERYTHGLSTSAAFHSFHRMQRDCEVSASIAAAQYTEAPLILLATEAAGNRPNCRYATHQSASLHFDSLIQHPTVARRAILRAAPNTFPLQVLPSTEYTCARPRVVWNPRTFCQLWLPTIRVQNVVLEPVSNAVDTSKMHLIERTLSEYYSIRGHMTHLPMAIPQTDSINGWTLGTCFIPCNVHSYTHGRFGVLQFKSPTTASLDSTIVPSRPGAHNLLLSTRPLLQTALLTRNDLEKVTFSDYRWMSAKLLYVKQSIDMISGGVSVDIPELLTIIPYGKIHDLKFATMRSLDPVPVVAKYKRVPRCCNLHTVERSAPKVFCKLATVLLDSRCMEVGDNAGDNTGVIRRDHCYIIADALTADQSSAPHRVLAAPVNLKLAYDALAQSIPTYTEQFSMAGTDDKLAELDEDDQMTSSDFPILASNNQVEQLNARRKARHIIGDPLSAKYRQLLDTGLLRTERRLAFLQMTTTFPSGSNNSNSIFLEHFNWRTPRNTKASLLHSDTDLDMRTFTSTTVDRTFTHMISVSESDWIYADKPDPPHVGSSGGRESGNSELLMDEPSCSIDFNESVASSQSSLYLSLPSEHLQVRSAPGDLYCWARGWTFDQQTSFIADLRQNEAGDVGNPSGSNNEYISLASSHHPDARVPLLRYVAVTTFPGLEFAHLGFPEPYKRRTTYLCSEVNSAKHIQTSCAYLGFSARIHSSLESHVVCLAATLDVLEGISCTSSYEAVVWRIPEVIERSDISDRSVIYIPPICPIKSTVFTAGQPISYLAQRFHMIDRIESVLPLSDVSDETSATGAIYSDATYGLRGTLRLPPRLRMGILLKRGVPKLITKRINQSTPITRRSRYRRSRRHSIVTYRASQVRFLPLPPVTNGDKQSNNINVSTGNSGGKLVGGRHQSRSVSRKPTASDAPLFQLRNLLCEMRKRRTLFTEQCHCLSSPARPRRISDSIKRSMLPPRKPTRSLPRSSFLKCKNISDKIVDVSYFGSD